MPSSAPAQGDVVWINMSPHAGHEQGGHRPAVVLSHYGYNKRSGLAVVCPVTRRQKGYPFEVPLPDDAGVAGVVLADQMRNVDWRARRADFIGKVNEEVIAEIWAKVSALLSPDTD